MSDHTREVGRAIVRGRNVRPALDTRRRDGRARAPARDARVIRAYMRARVARAYMRAYMPAYMRARGTR